MQPIQPEDQAKAVEKAGYNHAPSLVPEIKLIEALFSKQVDAKKEQATDRLEVGQNQTRILDRFQNIINASTTAEGMVVSDELKTMINKELDSDAFDQSQKSKDLLAILKTIKETVDSKGVPNFQPLFVFLNQDPDNTMSARLASLEIVDGTQPTEVQVQKFMNIIAEKEAKNNAREFRREHHNKLLELFKTSGLAFQAEPYRQEKFQHLFGELATKPEHPLNAKLAEIGIVAGQKPTDEQFKRLLEVVNGDESKEVRDSRKLLREEGIIKLPERFTRPQAENILHQTRQEMKVVEAFNNTETRKISELDSTMNKMYQALMSCAKTLHEIIKKFASGIRGG